MSVGVTVGVSMVQFSPACPHSSTLLHSVGGAHWLCNTILAQSYCTIVYRGALK